MTPIQKELVQQSFKQVLPIKDKAAELFYGRLFELDPALRPLFKGDMQQQGRMLMSVLAAAVNGLDRLDDLVPTLHALGRRHAGYGVQDAHYGTVATALLWTLGQGLGAAFTPEVRESWVACYGVLADVMRQGMQEAA